MNSYSYALYCYAAVHIFSFRFIPLSFFNRTISSLTIWPRCVCVRVCVRACVRDLV